MAAVGFHWAGIDELGTERRWPVWKSMAHAENGSAGRGWARKISGQTTTGNVGFGAGSGIGSKQKRTEKPLSVFSPRLIYFVWAVGLFWPGFICWLYGCWGADVIWNAAAKAGWLDEDALGSVASFRDWRC